MFGVVVAKYRALVFTAMFCEKQLATTPASRMAINVRFILYALKNFFLLNIYPGKTYLVHPSLYISFRE